MTARFTPPSLTSSAEFAWHGGGFTLLLLGIAATAEYSYLLFHTLIEICRIVVIFSVAALAWNARRQIDNAFLLLVGLASPSIGALDLLHTLAYKGMNIFPPDANLPTQLWIALRFFECFVMLSAAALLGRRQLPIGHLALGFLATGIALAWLVLSGRFPDCYVEGTGLTDFKINSEYVIAAGFVITLLLLRRHRDRLAPDILVLVVLAVVVDIAAEFAFTKYVSVYGNANLIGHLLLLTSTYFLYRALVLQGIQKPQFLLFQHLNREKELLARSEAELAIKVAERTAEVTESNRRLQDELVERRRVEQQLLESEEMLRLTRNVALDATIVIDAAGRVIVWNPAASRLFGYPADEVIGRSLHELIVPERFRAAAISGIRRFGSTGEGALIGRISELVAMRRDGSEVPVELSISTVQIRGIWHAIGIIRDITDRKAAVHAREQLAAIVESTGEAVIGKNLDGTVSTWNSGAARLYGYTAAEMCGGNVEALVPAELRDELANVTRRVASGEIVEGLETQRLHKNGTRLDVTLTLSPIHDSAGTICGISTIAHDITERKAADRALQRLNRRLKLLSASNQTLLYATTAEDLLNRMCRNVTGIGNFDGAWVGEIDPEKNVVRVACASDPDIAEALGSGAFRAIEAGTPLAEAVREKRPVIFANRVPHPPLAAVRAGIALPLNHRGEGAACLTLWTADARLLDAEEIPTLEELAADLDFGLVGLRVKIERERGLLALERAMEDMVRAIAGTVEMRDPYTAGHQRRVAELSRAIGQELGVPEDQLHATALAAMIHDLGKINVPAEILTRPGRLSEIEFEFIKTHPAAGFEIVRNIEFPWPIADAILQHHERLDGSGYPRGLKGDEIILEARIIAVADVVEAMCSHRPYRPELGIDAALDEILQGRGVTYDAAAVDACVHLFRDTGFQFSKGWDAGK